jgi:hypothetical protein
MSKRMASCPAKPGNFMFAGSFNNLGAFFAACRKKPGFAGLRYRSGHGATRRGCSAPLQSLARRKIRAHDGFSSSMFVTAILSGGPQVFFPNF